MKHTPGPWLREGNTVYALMHDGWQKGVEQFRNRFFVQVHVDVSCGDDEREAITSLIQGAPDLLNAVRFLLSNPDNRISAADRKSAYWAIAKATGEQP